MEVAVVRFASMHADWVELLERLIGLLAGLRLEGVYWAR
jgi:hypothetical protein